MVRFKLVLIAVCIGLVAKSQVAVTTGLSENISGLPGDVTYINVGVKNTSLKPRKVLLNLVDYYTTCDSGYIYKPAGTLDNSVSNWITMDIKEIVLDPGEKAIVVLKIDIPQDFLKPHATANLMVSNEAVKKPSTEDQISFGVSLQYAVNLIYTRMNLEEGFSDLIAENIEIDTVGSILKFKYLNSGIKTTSFTVQAEIITNGGEVILSEMTKSTQIQPNQCRDLTIPITQSMESGVYQVILVAKSSQGETFGVTHEINI